MGIITLKFCNKSLATNLISLGFIIIGWIIPAEYFKEQILATGYFAFSGAITNWLAIHMLFEKVPFLYGSGVIPTRFEEFKTSIKRIIMEQFFSPTNIERFLRSEEQKSARLINLEPLLKLIDYDKMFDSVAEAVMNTKFGSMLSLFGGASTLESLRAPFTEKVSGTLSSLTRNESFNKAIEASIDNQSLNRDVIRYAENLIDQRLQEITPQVVKKMVGDIIREHLGWLVVWGGVFGAVIGVLVSLID